MEAKIEILEARRLICPNQNGGHMGHDDLVKRSFLPIFDALKRKPFNRHGLRRFPIFCWIEAGMAPKTVQAFAGHASLQMTMDHYGHLFPSEDHRKAMDQIATGSFKNSQRTYVNSCAIHSPGSSETTRYRGGLPAAPAPNLRSNL